MTRWLVRVAVIWIVTAVACYEAAVHPRLQSAAVLAAVGLTVFLCARRSDAVNRPRAEGVQVRRRVVR